MAHFAKLDENNSVIEVHSVHNNELLDENGNESELKGIEFLTKWSGGYTLWKQTSYNATIRKNYAGIGYKYYADIDAFAAPQPYPSWTLDTNAQWQAPVTLPTDGKKYLWGEATLAWLEVTTE